jgi:hypothetical protein
MQYTAAKIQKLKNSNIKKLADIKIIGLDIKKVEINLP